MWLRKFEGKKRGSMKDEYEDGYAQFGKAVIKLLDSRGWYSVPKRELATW